MIPFAAFRMHWNSYPGLFMKLLLRRRRRACLLRCARSDSSTYCQVRVESSGRAGQSARCALQPRPSAPPRYEPSRIIRVKGSIPPGYVRAAEALSRIRINTSRRFRRSGKTAAGKPQPPFSGSCDLPALFRVPAVDPLYPLSWSPQDGR
jgi:hypothetical protein